MPKYPMKIMVSGADRKVRFEGPESSGFAGFAEPLPEKTDPVSEMHFLRRCDRRVEKACGNSACNEMVGVTYETEINDYESSLDRIGTRAIAGVYVSCDVSDGCPLYEKDRSDAQTAPLPMPEAKNRLLPARLR